MRPQEMLHDAPLDTCLDSCWDSWIFDLDNTLYSPKAGIFAQIDVRMASYIGELLQLDAGEARRVQKHFFQKYGTTLSGLMAEHGIEPHHFLDYVHDIDMSGIAPNPELAALIARLPGKYYIFTNADVHYAEKMLRQLGLEGLFQGIFDIHAQAYLPKPAPASYDKLCAAFNINPKRAIFFEDMARNLKPAHALGMTTVWLNNGAESGNLGAHPDFIDYETPDLAPWLAMRLQAMETENA